MSPAYWRKHHPYQYFWQSCHGAATGRFRRLNREPAGRLQGDLRASSTSLFGRLAADPGTHDTRRSWRCDGGLRGPPVRSGSSSVRICVGGSPQSSQSHNWCGTATRQQTFYKSDVWTQNRNKRKNAIFVTSCNWQRSFASALSSSRRRAGTHLSYRHRPSPVWQVN